MRDDAFPLGSQRRRRPEADGHHSPAFTLATYVHYLEDDLPDPSFLDEITGEGGNNEATSPTEMDVRAAGGAEAENRSDAAESLGTLRLV